MSQHAYQRTPLPEEARFFSGWAVAFLAGVIFCPFVGFALVGKVNHEGLVAGLVFAIAPLSGLAWLIFRRWRAWQRLPAQVVQEWTVGKLVLPDDSALQERAVRFTAGPDALDLNGNGVLISAPTLLSLNLGPSLAIKSLFDRLAGEHFVSWIDIQEWVVEDDSDGSDHYTLQLRSGGQVRIRRFIPSGGAEADILDAVRALGRVPVRLRCDL